MAVLGGTLAFAYASRTSTTQYIAQASLVVSDPQASTLFGADIAARVDAGRYVVDQVAILESDAVALRATELVGDFESLFLDRLDEADVRFGLEILSEPGSDEIVVRYIAENEAAAVASANAVIDAYAEVRREEALRNSASAIEQLDLSISQIDSELAGIEVQIAQTSSDPGRTELAQQFQLAIDRLVQLQPQLIAADGSIEDEQLAQLRAELQDLNEQFVTFLTINDIEQQQPQLVRLFAEQSAAVTRRNRLAEERDRLLVDTELLSGGVSLSSPARFARQIQSRVEVTAALGAMLGLLAGFGLAYILANRRRRFTERADPGWVLRAPLLAEVPNFGEESVPPPLPTLHNAQSASAEAFRFAATSLDLHTGRHAETENQIHGRARTFLFTSATLGDGKTVAVANVAIAASRKGRRVLVIDADFGNQMLTEILRGPSPKGPGITEVVEENLSLRSATHSLHLAGPLDLLSRGVRPTTAPDFFSLPATRALIERTGNEYDLVLVDGPPMLQVAYASTLARYVDQVVAVVPHGGSVSRIEDLAQRLELIGTPLAGYIYNWAPLRFEMTLSEGSLRDVVGGN